MTTTEKVSGKDVETIMMHHVTSSNVLAFGYSESARVLRVKWKAGQVGEYLDVPLQVYEDLKEANSYGSFIHHGVKPYYRYRFVEFGDTWDGEERRTVNEPLDFDEEAMQTTHQLTLKDGKGNRIRLECLDLTAEDEKLFAARMVNCVNACATLPSDRILEVVNAGLIALGEMDRRKAQLAAARVSEVELTPKPVRRLTTVLTQIISLIPVEQGTEVDDVYVVELCKALESIKGTAEFAAPEVQPSLWRKTAAILSGALGLSFAEGSWKDKVARVFAGDLDLDRANTVAALREQEAK